MTTKLDLDLRFDRVDLSESFNNFIVITKSGFMFVLVLRQVLLTLTFL